MNALFAKTPVKMKIPDLEAGYQFLSRLSLANVQQAGRDVHQFLDSLLQASPPADVYLQLLEQTRISLCFIGDDLARRYTAKPLPLGDHEEDVFQEVVGLWRKAARVYAHCAQIQPSQPSVGHHERLALILHRCIYYTGMAIMEHFRARRQLPAGLWLDLHGYFASAEEWGVATTAVPDALDSLGRSTHCSAAFVSVLLIDLAGPYMLSVRDLGWLLRWVGTWAPLVGIHPIEPGEPRPQVLVDLMKDSGLLSGSEDPYTDSQRRLDTALLAVQLNDVRRQLRNNIAPQQLGLGEDCNTTQCHRLVKRLSRSWLLMQVARKYRRYQSSGTWKVCAGVEGIHFLLSGRTFSQPDSGRLYSRQEFEALFAFRHTIDPAQTAAISTAQPTFAFDDWQVFDQCATGFRLVRAHAGRRMQAGQLLAVCPHGGTAPMLAQIVWLIQEQGGGLSAGIAAMPGRPQAVAARPSSPSPGHADPYSRAFVLPAVPTIGAEPTLVIAKGWFYSERILDIYVDGGVRRVKLQKLIGEGPDFERVTFLLL